MLLIARFYLKKRPQDTLQDMFMEPSAQEASLYDEESLVAWTAIPLVLCADNGKLLKEVVRLLDGLHSTAAPQLAYMG